MGFFNTGPSEIGFLSANGKTKCQPHEILTFIGACFAQIFLAHLRGPDVGSLTVDAVTSWDDNVDMGIDLFQQLRGVSTDKVMRSKKAECDCDKTSLLGGDYRKISLVCQGKRKHSICDITLEWNSEVLPGNAAPPKIAGSAPPTVSQSGWGASLLLPLV